MRKLSHTPLPWLAKKKPKSTDLGMYQRDERNSVEVRPALGEIPVRHQSGIESNLYAEEREDLSQSCPLPKATLHGNKLSGAAATSTTEEIESVTSPVEEVENNNFPATTVLQCTLLGKTAPYLWAYPRVLCANSAHLRHSSAGSLYTLSKKSAGASCSVKGVCSENRPPSVGKTEKHKLQL